MTIASNDVRFLVKRTFSIVLVLLVMGISVAPTYSLRNSRWHSILNVPWHEQLNALSCGPASLEIVFDYYGPDVDQKEIANVARTSSMGTWTFDVERAGHFSYLSSAQGRFFPSAGPSGGFEERPLGYASFSHSSSSFWLDELKALIDRDIPVVVLMKYTPSGGGGHYRVVIGYDDRRQLVYFSDPWGRDTNHLTDWTGVISWSYADFERGWNYSEYGLANPFFGVAIIPWSVGVTMKGTPTEGSVITVTTCVQYKCPEPFDDAQYPAKNAKAQITVPEGTTLLSSSAIVPLGSLNAGGSATVTWKLLCNTNATGKTISVSAWGVVSGTVPEAHWNGETVYYPAYTYDDAIGGETRALL